MLKHDVHSQRRILISILLAATLLAADRIGSLLLLPTPVERLDLYLSDLAFSLRGLQTPTTPIVIVAIDDASLNYTGYHWPWPRTYLAKIVDILNTSGARVIALDVFLFERDPDPAGDPALAQALGNARAAVSVMNISRADHTETLNLPVEPYPAALDGIGLAGFVADNDAMIRSIQAYDTSAYDGQVYFNWALETARLYLGASPPSSYSSGALEFAGQQAPLHAGQLLLDFAGPPGSFPYYPAYQVAMGDFPAQAFKDKIVLIGATSVTLQDIYPAPFSVKKRMPGVELSANAIHTLVSGRFLYVAPPLVELALLLLAAVIAWVISRRKNPRQAMMLMGAGMLGYGVVWMLVFLLARWQFGLATPELMLLLGVSIPAFDQMISEELEKRRMQNLFGHFVSPEIISQLLKAPNISSLNKRAHVSILFADIRNFTSLSERLSPDEVVGMLNPYLERMTGVIHKHGGTIDKYIGDAIVAFFGEPLGSAEHARQAVRAAIDMHAALDELRREWRKDDVVTETFEIGIGIHSGDVFVGMIGSQQHMNYTVIGDAVNTAARLQEQTKFHGGPILISEQVYQQVQDETRTEFVEERMFRGKQDAVRMYRVLGYR